MRLCLTSLSWKFTEYDPSQPTHSDEEKTQNANDTTYTQKNQKISTQKHQKINPDVIDVDAINENRPLSSTKNPKVDEELSSHVAKKPVVRDDLDQRIFKFKVSHVLLFLSTNRSLFCGW